MRLHHSFNCRCLFVRFGADLGAWTRFRLTKMSHEPSTRNNFRVQFYSLFGYYDVTKQWLYIAAKTTFDTTRLPKWIGHGVQKWDLFDLNGFWGPARSPWFWGSAGFVLVSKHFFKGAFQHLFFTVLLDLLWFPGSFRLGHDFGSTFERTFPEANFYEKTGTVQKLGAGWNGSTRGGGGPKGATKLKLSC